MKMQISEVYSQIKSFKFYDSKKIVFNNLHEIFIDKIKVLESEISLQEINLNKNYFFIVDSHGKNTHLIIDNYSVKKFEFQILQICDNYIITNERIDNQKVNICRELNSSKELFQFNTLSSVNLYLDEKLIRFNRKNNIIECYKLPYQIPIWNFDVNDFPKIPNKDFINPLNPWEVKKIIGIIDGKLWLAMNHRTIFALSILNGDLIFNISNIPDFHKTEVHDSIPLPEATYILEDENKLIGFIGRYYWEINATNGEIQITDKTVDFLNEKISNDNEKFVLDKELIFFINNSSQICCFNRKTHFIDWRYSFDKIEPEYRIQLIEIQGNRNKLGVKDLNNNLYILESEL